MYVTASKNSAPAFHPNNICRKYNFFEHIVLKVYQWRNGSVFKTSKQQGPGSIPCAFRPSRSAFSVVFLRNWRKYGLGSLRNILHGGYFIYSPRSHKRTVGFKHTDNKLKVYLNEIRFYSWNKLNWAVERNIKQC